MVPPCNRKTFCKTHQEYLKVGIKAGDSYCPLPGAVKIDSIINPSFAQRENLSLSITGQTNLRIVKPSTFSRQRYYRYQSCKSGPYFIGNTLKGLVFINDGYHLERMCDELMALPSLGYRLPFKVKRILHSAIRAISPTPKDPGWNSQSSNLRKRVHKFLRRICIITDDLGTGVILNIASAYSAPHARTRANRYFISKSDKIT